jgi:hypothetical protein
MTIHVIDTNIVSRLSRADQPRHFDHAKRLMDEVLTGKQAGDHVSASKDTLAIFSTNNVAFVDAIVLAPARSNRWHYEHFNKRLPKLAAVQGRA